MEEHYKKKKAEAKNKGRPKIPTSQSIHGYPIASMASFGRAAMRRYLKNPPGIAEENGVNPDQVPEIKVQVGSDDSSSISDESDTSESSSSPGTEPTEPQQDHNYH